MSSEASHGANRVDFGGCLQAKGALRYTPAGIPVIEFRLGHVSEQRELEQLRRVDCELACLALGPQALLLDDAPLGQALQVSGFLAAKSLKNRQPVLHVNKIEFLEGANHGV